ncbi:MAG: phosphate ABC transporter permease PstA [Pseudomonadota bacterium]
MTDAAHASSAAERLKRRRAADARFAWYGRAAVCFALGALIILIGAIVWQATSAFTHHKVRFDLELDPTLIAPNGLDDPEAIAENVSGFHALIRDDLSDTFPETRSSEQLTGELHVLVTRLAVLPVARETADTPSTIGTQQTFWVAFSDDLDLFLKGLGSPQSRLHLPALSGAVRTEAGDLALIDARARFSPIVRALDGSTRDPSGEGPSVLVQTGGLVLKAQTVQDDRIIGTVLAGGARRLGDLEGAAATVHVIEQPEAERNVTDAQIAWTLVLKADGRIERRWNGAFFSNADSTYPELAGVLAAIAGSLLLMMVTAALAVPVGIAAAVYLEEFAPTNRLTRLIEVNINNLAAVPSIVFGLLGAAVFLNAFGLPRSAPLIGGLVLSLLTLPTVIIASRAGLKAVPRSIRDAALAVGASPTQAVFHHVLPLAAPGMLTGAIIGLARALGETAPLLLIGMVAFVAEVPSGPGDEATALPVLIYKWSTGAERAWEPMTAAAIVVLLVMLVFINGTAVILRRHFERTWK